MPAARALRKPIVSKSSHAADGVGRADRVVDDVDLVGDRLVDRRGEAGDRLQQPR